MCSETPLCVFVLLNIYRAASGLSCGARAQQLQRVGLLPWTHVGSQFPDRALNPHPRAGWQTPATDNQGVKFPHHGFSACAAAGSTHHGFNWHFPSD